MESERSANTKYIRNLMRAQYRCLAAMEAMAANIEATKQLEYLCSEINFDSLKTISALVVENEELKKCQKVEYVSRLREENGMLRSLHGLSPLSKTPPPLPKPNQLGFMSADYDIEKLQISKRDKTKSLEAIGNLIKNGTVSPFATRSLVQAENIVRSSIMEDDRLIDNFWAYRQRKHREEKEEEMRVSLKGADSPTSEAEQSKRKRENEEWECSAPAKFHRQDSSSTDCDEEDNEDL